MVVVPLLTAVITPAVLAVATAVALLLHVPPGVALLKVVVPPGAHIVVTPVIGVPQVLPATYSPASDATAIPKVGVEVYGDVVLIEFSAAPSHELPTYF
jgi:multisubunit Na+/H+ antiporter MnhB subunit